MIAVLADTHMPKGGRRLPERAVELLRGAEAAPGQAKGRPGRMRRRSPRHSMGLLKIEAGRPVFEHVWL